MAASSTPVKEAAMKVHGLGVGKTSEWFTPGDTFEKLRLTFDLDPAHPGRDNPHCKVPTRWIFTISDDGLRQPWHGLVWLNAPYGARYGQVPWLKRFLVHRNGVCLISALTGSNWFHSLVVPAAETMVLLRGKVKFVRPDGTVGTEPATGSALIGMGPVANAALKQSGLGLFIQLREPAAIAVVEDMVLPKILEEEVAS
jgi:hypothetical protein